MFWPPVQEIFGFYLGQPPVPTEQPVEHTSVAPVPTSTTPTIDSYIFKDGQGVHLATIHGDSFLPPDFVRPTTTLSSVDVPTFRRISGEHRLSSPEGLTLYAYFADKNSVYYYEIYDGLGGQVDKFQNVKVDIATFRPVENATSTDAQDKNYQYYKGQVVR